MVFLAMKSAQSVNQLATVEGVRTATGRKQCCFFFLTCLGVVLRCFGVFRIISGIVFKADILSTIFSNNRLVSRIRLSISVAATAPIGYRIRVLEAIGAVKHDKPGLCAP